MSPTASTTAARTGTLAFVGAGPGDPGLLTVRAAGLLAAADLVLHDPEIPADLLAGAGPDAVVEPASGTPAERGKRLAAGVRAGQAVVRLVCGDPFVFGTAAEEAEACTRAKVGYDVVPGLLTELVSPVYAGMTLPGRKGGEVRIVDLDRLPEPEWSGLAAAGSAVLRGSVAEVARAAELLVGAGASGRTPVAVTVAGGSVGQQTVTGSLGTLAADLAAAAVDGPAVAVVGSAVSGRDKLSWWESKPLFGWRVLVPRTREQASTLSDRLRAYGATPVEVPTIAVEPPRTPAAMDRAVKGLVSGRYLWVVFTSTNSVRAMQEKLVDLGLDVRAFAGIKVAAVGEQTSAALRSWGVQPELVAPAEAQSSEGLLSIWPVYDDVFDPIDRVLLPRADIATETLAAGLVERGWQVDDVTAYRTVRAAPPAADIRDAIKGGGFDAVLFTSSSTARNLVGIAGKPHASTVIAVIGPQTERTAEELGLRVDVRSPEPSVAALAEALAEHGVARRAAGEPVRPAARPARAARPKPAKKPAVEEVR